MVEAYEGGREPIVIIENGSAEMKAGFASEEHPSVTFPPDIARNK